MINHFYHQKFPTLDLNDQFYLREQSLEDTTAFFQYYSDPDVARHILASNPKTLPEAHGEIMYCRNLFYQKSGIYWSIARKDNDQMIGAVGLYINNNHHRAEICYDLAKEYWRQGIITEAIRQVLEFSFNTIDIQRMEAQTIKENEASTGVLKKLGFVHEGELSNYRYFQGQSYDIEMYAITPKMFIQHTQKTDHAVET